MEIRTTTGSDRELAAVAQLKRILGEFDLRRYVFTDLVRIEPMVVARSHPVLRLNTRHLQDDHAALATFVHEQLHWWLHDHPGADAALEVVRARWPEPPPPSAGGAMNPFSTWAHLVLCPVEVRALDELFGPGLRDDPHTGVYSWIYSEIQANADWFARLVEDHGLMPPTEAPTPIRWPASLSLASGVSFYCASPDADQQVLQLLELTHERYPVVVGERDVVVDSSRPTSLHPGLQVGSEHLADPLAFAATYAFAQGAVWASGRLGRGVELPAEVLSAVAGDPFPSSTAIAGALVLRAMGLDASAGLARTLLADRLRDVVPLAPTILDLLVEGGLLTA